MKFSLAVVAVSSLVSTAFAGPRATSKLMKAARRLENAEEEEEQEYGFLADYKLKLISCNSGELYVNPENGENEYSSVVFRLCPSDSCDDEGSAGCTSGNGDFVVGLNSFVENYLEDKRDDMQQDDAFKVEEFGECREYEVDQDAQDDEGDDQQQVQYFVGPSCSEDGTDIVLDMFIDETCTTQSEEVTFYDISNGLSLPYSNGGLVSSYCESCAGYNDNGEWELSEMCMRLYENSGKCETNMESYHYNGQQVDSCEFIESLVPRRSTAGAGKVIGWIFAAAFILGASYIAYTMYKKKDDRTASLMNA